MNPAFRILAEQRMVDHLAVILADSGRGPNRVHNGEVPGPVIMECAYHKADLVEFQVDILLLNERQSGLDVQRWSCFRKPPAALENPGRDRRRSRRRFGLMNGSPGSLVRPPAARTGDAARRPAGLPPRDHLAR